MTQNKLPRGRIKSNEQLYCEVEKCNKHRNGLSKYCACHRRRYRLYGHPTVHPYQFNRYQWATNKVEKYLLQYITHPAIQEAIRRTDVLLNGHGIRSMRLKDVMAKQKNAGLTAYKLLLHVLAMCVYEKEGNVLGGIPSQFHSGEENLLHWRLVVARVISMQPHKESDLIQSSKLRIEFARELRAHFLQYFLGYSHAALDIPKKFPKQSCVNQLSIINHQSIGVSEDIHLKTCC